MQQHHLIRPYILTDIGNPNMKTREKILNRFVGQHKIILRLFETYFNGFDVMLNAESSYEQNFFGHLFCEFKIDEIGSVRLSLAKKTLLSLFTHHLNMGNEDTKNQNILTESHRNLFYNLGKKLLGCYHKEALINRVNSEHETHYDIQLVVKAELNKVQHDIFVSFEMGESNPNHTVNQKFPKDDIKEVLKKVPVKLDTILMSRTYTLADVNELKSGDIIQLDNHTDVNVKIVNKSIFNGHLTVQEDNQLGVKYE